MPVRALITMILSLLCAFVWTSGPIAAQERCKWDGSTGRWSEAQRWDCGAVPGTQDHAVITVGEVQLEENAAVANLELFGGTLTGSGDLEVTGAMAWTGGAMAGTGTTTLAPGGLLSIEGDVTLDRPLVNEGAATWSDGEVDGAGAFTNREKAVFTTAVDANEFSSAFTNERGALLDHGNYPRFLGAFTNEGLVDMGCNSLDLRGGSSSAGTFNLNCDTSVLFFGDGNHTLAETATLNGIGLLVFQGAVTNQAAVNPGRSPGVLTVRTATYAPGSSARLNVELGGTQAGSGYDRLVVEEEARPNGTLNVTLIDGFIPEIGHAFDVLTYADRTGDFDQVNLPELEEGKQWRRTFTATGMQLRVVEPALRADARIGREADFCERDTEFGTCTEIPAGNDAVTVAPGERIVVQYVATNVGSADLVQHAWENSRGSGGATSGTLLPGETRLFGASYFEAPSQPGEVQYTLVWRSLDESGNEFTDTDAFTVTVQPPPPVTRRWKDPVDGNWSDPDRWDPAGMPAAGDTVVIDADGTYTVTVDLPDAVVGSLRLGSLSNGQGNHLHTLRLPAESQLTLGAASEVTFSVLLNLGGGTLTGSGDLTVKGALNWTSGMISGSGALVTATSSTFTLSGPDDKVLRARRVSTNWRTTVEEGNLVLAEGAVIENKDVFDLLNGSGLLAGTEGGTFRNQVILRNFTEGSTSTVSADVLNSGTVSAGLSTLAFTGVFENLPEGYEGTLDVEAAAFEQNGTIKPGGASQGTMTLAGDLPLSPSSVLRIGLERADRYDRLLVRRRA